jgi:hypothetical protein
VRLACEYLVVAGPAGRGGPLDLFLFGGLAVDVRLLGVQRHRVLEHRTHVICAA